MSNSNQRLPTSDKITNDYILSKLKEKKPETMSLNEKGLSSIFSDVFKDVLRWNVTQREWFYYDGKHWSKDEGGMYAARMAKQFSDVMIVYGTSIDNEKIRTPYMKIALTLGQYKKRRTMIDDSRDCYFMSDADLDTNPYLLNCQNGILNLKTFEFIPHNPAFLLSKIANASYRPDMRATLWDKFIDDIMQSNNEKIRYLQKIHGLSLTGCTEQESFFLYYGKSTRNGKGTLCESFSYMLGGSSKYSYSGTITPETLAQKHNCDSSRASPEIAKLAGVRFLNCSEPKKKMLFDTALVKTLVGRDQIVARELYHSEFSFMPQFKLVINSNYLPVVQDDTLFSSDRVNVITFDRHFEPEERDYSLKEKLQSDECMSAILNWSLEGLKLYYSEGMIAPKCVKAATDEYQIASDKIANFVSECLERSDQNSTVKEVYEKYSDWCKDNGFGVENKRNFKAALDSRGMIGSGKAHGVSYKDVVMHYIIPFEPVDEDSETPFT